jgi:hypothetical protein
MKAVPWAGQKVVQKVVQKVEQWAGLSVDLSAALLVG